MIKINDNLAQKIESDGFVIIKNVLAKNEVIKLREIVKNHFSCKGMPSRYGLIQTNAAIEVPEISWLFYHPKILAVMRHLLRQEEVMFTSHCDVFTRRLSQWHKDDGMRVMDGGYFGKPAYDRDDCHVYKVAIYLQDHIHNRGGLTVKKGSHKFPSIDQGEEIYLKTRGGDVIVFDVRLSHIGQRYIVPIPIVQKFINLGQKVLNKFLKIDYSQTNNYLRGIYEKISEEKMAIFFTYGLPNEYTKNFAINNMKRQIKQNNNTDIFLSSSTQKIFHENNVLLAEDYFNKVK